jgi:hypothetical protein
MRKHIVIDYINLVAALHLVRKHRGSNVTALFCPSSIFKERFLIIILNIFNIRYQLDSMKFSKLSVDPYQEILVDTNNMVNKLILLNEVEASSKTMSCFNHKLRNVLFHLLWRPNSIFKYVKKYNKIDGIYISIKTKKIFLNQYYSLLPDDHYKKIVYFYKSSGKVDDAEYWSRSYVSRKIRFLAYIFYIPLGFKSKYRKIDSLLFSHPIEFTQDSYNGLGVGKFLNFKYKIAWPDGTVGQESDSLTFRSIYWKDFVSYLLHLKNGLIKFYPFIFSIGFDVYIILVRYWVSLFLLRSFYQKHSVRVVYSNYDSDFTQLALAVASDDNKIVSFAAVWSIGNFPLEEVITLHKFADRLFIWGEWHYSLFTASKDKSSGYVITGYIGDIDLLKIQKNATLLRSKYKKNYNNIIALYDTSIFHDLFYNAEIANKLLKAVMKVAEQSNSLVILKTKFKSDFYSKTIRHYSNNLIVNCEKNSLEPALAADVVVGVENSTPSSLAALCNKRVVNFNPADSVWKHWKLNIGKDITMVESCEKLSVELLKKLKMIDEPYTNMSISAFLDGKSQKRMAQYMNDVSDKMHLEKIDALAYADINYIDKYGLDKIIINE